MFATGADSPYKTLADLLKAARAQPGKLNMGTIAVGSTQHLGAELFRSLAKLDIQLIPYKTTPDAMIGTIRNDVQLMTDFYAAMHSVLVDKKLRPLATSGTKRSAFLPDVPTVAEAGVPGYEVLSWNGLGAPAATPQPIIDTLNKAVREVLAMPDVIKRYARSASPRRRARRRSCASGWRPRSRNGPRSSTAPRFRGCNRRCRSSCVSTKTSSPAAPTTCACRRCRA